MAQNLTDIIIIFIACYYFIRGWQKGFLRTIFGPISLILGSVVSYIYFQQTHNLAISLLIGLIGPFILNFALSILIKIWQKATDQEKDFFTIGRLFGAVCNLFWGLSIALLIGCLIILIPIKITGLIQIQQNIKSSQCYKILNKIFHLEKQKEKIGLDTLQQILSDPDKIARFKETEGFRELIKDEKLKNLLSDEKLMTQIKNKNFGQLLKNPEFMDLLNDPELSAKILAAYQDILKLEQNNNKGSLTQ